MKDDRKTRYTRMVLRDSLIELMKQKPISKITIKELCEKADINRTTFYAHYTDQYALLRQIQDDVLSWLKEAMATVVGKTDRAGTIAFLQEVCEYVLDNSGHLQVLMSEQGDINFQKELLTLIYQQCGMSSPSTANTARNMDQDAFIFVVSGSVGLIRHWLKDGCNKSAKEMAETLYVVTEAIQ